MHRVTTRSKRDPFINTILERSGWGMLSTRFTTRATSTLSSMLSSHSWTRRLTKRVRSSASHSAFAAIMQQSQQVYAAQRPALPLKVSTRP